MAYDSVNVTPNQGLGVAAGIAQGAANFMQAYQSGVNQRNYYSMVQQQMQSEQQLRQLQMQKLQQEINPVQVDVQKLSILSKMADANPDLNSLYVNQIKDTVKNANTPAQLSYLNQLADQHLKSQMGQPSQVMPSNLGYASQQIPGPVQPGQPSLSYDKEISGPPAPGSPQMQSQLPTQAKYEQMGMSQPSEFPSAQPQQSPQDPRSYMGVNYQDLKPEVQDMLNGKVNLNTYEQKLLEKMIADRTASTMALGRNATQLQLGNMRNMSNEEIKSMMLYAQDEWNRRNNDTRRENNITTNETRAGIADSTNNTKQNIALGHDATSRANQQVRSGAKAGGKDPDQAQLSTIDKNIQTVTKQMGDLYKKDPLTGATPSDETIQSGLKYYQAQLSELHNQRQDLVQKIRGGSSSGSSSQASGLPSLARSKQDVAGLPAGSLFNWQGGGSMPAGIYKKQADGQLVPVGK